MPEGHGIDYQETFAPVVKYESVRILLAMAASNKMQVHQMDVTTAFLNAYLNEEAFVIQPEGFVVEGKEACVLKLQKSLYGLKQAPLEWYLRTYQVLQNMGFKRNRAEYGLCSKTTSKVIILVALFVDNILIAASSDYDIAEVKQKFHSHFKMKDLGQAMKFLGMNITKQLISKSA